MSRLPPLNALRAFESAGRHLSISKAADELNVTPAAVSHHVKALETYLQVPLFRRLTRALVLTDAGQVFLPGLREGFDSLAQAVERVRAQSSAAGSLTVSTGPSFAAKWLVPRLDSFRQTSPDIDVRIDATDQVADLHRGEADIAIRFGSGQYPRLEASQLFTDEVFPVCAPQVCAGSKPLNEPGDLRHHTLLHVELRNQADTEPSWRMWLLAAGVRDVDATRGPKFSVESMAVQSAVEGQGVALASAALVVDDLAAGRLVRPFELGLVNNFAYYVVMTPAAAKTSKVAAFKDWLLTQAAMAFDQDV